MAFWKLLSLNTLEKATLSLHNTRFPSFYNLKGPLNRLYSVLSMEEASRIDSHVYVGTLAAATNEDLLHRLSISLIVDCANQYYDVPDPRIQIIHRNIRDHGVLTIKEYLNSINQIIDSTTSKEENVLIHCFYGMTRSCSCAIAYFMWKQNKSYDEAYSLVKSKRPQCDIPYDYEVFLREYGNQLNGHINHQIDHIDYNAVITITVPSSLSIESTIATVNRFTNIEKDIHIGNYEITEGHYGMKEVCFQLYIPSSCNLEDVEYSLNNYLDESDISSLRIEYLDE